MRRILICLAVMMFLSATLAFANPDGEKARASVKKEGNTASTAAPHGAVKKAESAKASGSALAKELQRLENLIQSQQQELEEQRNEIGDLQRRLGAGDNDSRVVPEHKNPAPSADPIVEATPSPSKVESTSESVAVVAPSGEPAPGAAPRQETRPKAIELAGGKIQLGFLFYGDYGYYYNTGFGPQFLTQINQPGPGNDGFNSFDVTRTYINFFYSPNDRITLRITPNIFRELGGASATKFGQVSAVGSNINGNLTVRLKYAYVDFNRIFGGSETWGKDRLTIGQETDPLVDWEESLYGFRFVNLTPWNYLSLSSTFTGISLRGPIEFGGKQYLDYDVGVFDSGNFHQQEQSDRKQVMARLSYYPFGASENFQGLGITGFVDYGYGNIAPDTNDFPLYRVAGLLHYTTRSKNFGLAAEMDYGRNAFTSGNLFSGSGPQDEFGLGPTPFATFDALAKALLNNNGARQRGFDFFGHVAVPHSPFTAFGMYEYFLPNVNANPDPLDFERIVAGVSYKYNDHLRFAIDSQNEIYVHNQFTFSAAELAQFSSALAASNPNGIPNAVPKNDQAIFANVEMSF